MKDVITNLVSRSQVSGIYVSPQSNAGSPVASRDMSDVYDHMSLSNYMGDTQCKF
jgi:hypothetical protein